MSARAELISMVNDIRLDFDRGRGTLGEVTDRVLEIARRVIVEEGPQPRVIPSRNTDPVTSHAAGLAVNMRAGTQRADLLGAFDQLNEATDEEAMHWAGVSPQSEYAKRCSELREAGFIEPTGDSRPGASGNLRMISRITSAGATWVHNNTK